MCAGLEESGGCIGLEEPGTDPQHLQIPAWASVTEECSHLEASNLYFVLNTVGLSEAELDTQNFETNDLLISLNKSIKSSLSFK
jgi:hypothetical protein